MRMKTPDLRAMMAIPHREARMKTMIPVLPSMTKTMIPVSQR
jgi:hypothetical protein